MPTQTFFNLPEEKRNKIIESAIDEFSNRPYEAASLSKIVEEAGISKGSMYQYFEDKKDLYMHLLDVAGQTKLQYMAGIINPTDDFFTVIRNVIIASGKFNLEHPRLAQIVLHMFLGSSAPFTSTTFAHLRKAGQAWVKQLLEKAQVEKQVRTDIDLDLLAYLVNRMTMDFGTYLMEQANVTYDDMLKGTKIPEDLIVSSTDKFILILHDGIGTQKLT